MATSTTMDPVIEEKQLHDEQNMNGAVSSDGSPKTESTIQSSSEQKDTTTTPTTNADDNEKNPSKSHTSTTTATTTTTTTTEEADHQKEPSSAADSEAHAEAHDPELDGDAPPQESAVKHQLQCSWTLWYDGPSKKTSASWEQNLQLVYTFNTVEDFWSVFNHIKPPSSLFPGSNYHLFKEGIRPMWEDQANKEGGKWLVMTEKPNEHKSLDFWWMNTVMACIGETFEPGEEICGVVVSLRKDKNRLALWTKTASDEALCLQIGKQFHKHAGISPNVRLAYMVHEDALRSSPSYRNKGRYRL